MYCVEPIFETWLNTRRKPSLNPLPREGRLIRNAMLNQTLIREADRKTFLRKIAMSVIYCVVGSGIFVAIIYLMDDGSRNTFSSFWLAYLLVAMNLIDSKEWDSWPIVYMVGVPAIMILGSLIPSIYQFRIPLFILWPFIIACYVQILRYRYGAKYCEQDVDAIAASLGLRWEDQSLWQMNEKIKNGKRDEMIKQYRDEHHSTWDEAHQAMAEWSGTQLELKLHLLREYVAKARSLQPKEVACSLP